MTKKESYTAIGSPIKDFVSQTIKEINAGLPKDYGLTSQIAFELSVVNSQVKKGKVDLRVLSLGGDVASQNTQKVSFTVGNSKLAKQAESQLKKVFKTLVDLDKKPTKRKRK